MVREYETTSNYDQKLKYLFKKKTGHSYKQQLLFPFNFKKRYVTWPTKTKQSKKENMCNQWQTLPSEVVVVQMTTSHSSNSPLLLFAPTVIWSQLSWGLGSTIHKYQAAAFSSIVIVIYKVHALHFLTQPQGSSPLWPCPCRSHTALDFLFYPPTSPLAQQRSLRSCHGCCLSAPPAASCVTAMTPALLASSAHLQSDGT